jgi:hypothetical protein
MHTPKPLLWVTLPGGGYRRRTAGTSLTTMTPGFEDSGSSYSWDSCQHWSNNERGTLRCIIAQSYSCAPSASRPRKPQSICSSAQTTRKWRHASETDTDLFSQRRLRLWDWLELLQGRVHPSWKSMIPTPQQDMQRTASTATVIQQLLRASLETWYCGALAE